MQKLIMPFKRQMMLCGYKNSEYKRHWGYHHYGIDLSSIQGGVGKEHTVYASGSGEIVTVGPDNRVGNVIVVIYREVYNHKTGESRDLVARYMHLESIAVRAGQKISQGDVLGVEGKSGMGGWDYHLHLEFDTDTSYPCYSPQVAGGTILKKGTDSSVNPSDLLYVGEGQVVVDPTYNPAWLNSEDFTIPVLPKEAAVSRAEYEQLMALYLTAKDKAERYDRIAAITKD